MLSIETSNVYKKAYKRAIKRGLPIDKLNDAVLLLANQKVLPHSFRDHALVGKYVGYRECHIQPDWLLVYSIDNEKLVLFLLDTGTHSDIFG